MCNSTLSSRKAGALALGIALLFGASSAMAAATIVIENNNAAGVGFNDPTAAAPVGGNSGTTLGEQRLIAFQHAADIWGATLDSSVTIVVRAAFEPLACTATGAVLGSAGAFNIFNNFTGALVADTWYPQALANKLSGVNQEPGDPDISARFNSRLGLAADCLPGSPFYLGLDNNHGAAIDLVAVLLHELGHGLGFQTFTSGSSGAQQEDDVAGPLPSIWDHFLYDNSFGLNWTQMTDAQRATSARNTGQLVWTGANVTNDAATVLRGPPVAHISGPKAGAAAGQYTVGSASFGPNLTSTPTTAQLMPVVDTAPNLGLACTPLSPNNALAVRGRIALVDRGACTFVTKALTAQAAGAIGVIVANNQGTGAISLGGADPNVLIPVVSVSQIDGARLKAAMQLRSRTSSGVIARLQTDETRLAGVDPAGRLRMYAPNPFEGGSSVSHFDTSASPNLIMEPAISGDLPHAVTAPQDLTFDLFKDIGW